MDYSLFNQPSWTGDQQNSYGLGSRTPMEHCSGFLFANSVTVIMSCLLPSIIVMDLFPDWKREGCRVSPEEPKGREDKEK